MEENFDNKGFEKDVEDHLPNKMVLWDIPLNTTNLARSINAIEAVPDDEVLKVSERKQWNNQWEFLLSCVSLAVGIANVWRFPVTAYENGGGAFLIPYLIVVFFIQRPVYFLELTLGQFISYSQIKTWKMCPLFKGIPYMSMVATISISSYYVSIMAITLFYMAQSFQKYLPWHHCDETWAGANNCNGSISATNTSLTELYFINGVIREAKSIENGIGTPDWRLVMCLFTCWAMIGASFSRGVQSFGKVAYFTAIFPYIVLFILLVRGLTLPGAWTGILYFIKPDWSKLLEPKVWFAAISQSLFSMAGGFGSVIMFGSYNPFRHNIYRDSLIVSMVDTSTSLLAGFTTFAILGNLALETGRDVSQVVQGGVSLVFLSYPDVIGKFGWYPQLFAVLFFAMMVTLAMGSIVAEVGAVTTQICDKFPSLTRWHVVVAVCLIECAIGIIYTTPGGQFMVTLVDFFAGSFLIYTVVLLELIGVAWVYGISNYVNDVQFMLNIKLSCYWKICWGIINPVFLLVILIYSICQDLTPKYKGISFPTAAIVCGWLLPIAAIMTFPAGAIYSMRKIPGTISEKFWGGLKPQMTWGPRDPQDYKEWVEFKRSRPNLSLIERLKLRKF